MSLCSIEQPRPKILHLPKDGPAIDIQHSFRQQIRYTLVKL